MATIISPRIKINAAQLKAEFARFSAVEKKQILDTTLRNDVKGFVRDVIAITPPGSAGAPLSAGGAGDAAVKRHKIKIYRDLLKIFRPLSDGVIDHANKQAMRGGNHIHLYNDGTREVWVTLELFHPSLDQAGFSAQHANHWQRGRVRNIPDNMRWVVRKDALMAFAETLYQKSGILAGGWAAAAREFKVRMPAIMKRHATGSVQVTIKDDHWHMRTENTVGYATEADMNRRVEFALDSRKRSARIANSIKHQIIAKLKQRGVTS
jgi:hypothetical protein